MKLKNEKHIHSFKKIGLALGLVVIFTSCGKHNLDLEEALKPASLTVSSSLVEGKYSSSPSFELKLSKNTETSEILYCINSGVYNANYCCDPLSEGISAKGVSVSGTAGTTDGKYCLAFIGFTDLETSDVGHVLFEIDTSAPDIYISTKKRMIQSNQYIDIAFTSSIIGQEGYFFSTLNYQTAQGTDCDVINSSDNFTSNGMDLNRDSNPDTIDLGARASTGFFSQIYRGKDLAFFGDNFLYFALVDAQTDPMLSSCPGINIVLNDFNIFEFSSNGDMVANASGEFEAVGTFNSFGGGVKKGNTGTTQLQTGLINIIH